MYSTQNHCYQITSFHEMIVEVMKKAQRKELAHFTTAEYHKFSL